jgi:hypothetical protein
MRFFWRSAGSPLLNHDDWVERLDPKNRKPGTSAATLAAAWSGPVDLLGALTSQPALTGLAAHDVMIARGRDLTPTPATSATTISCFAARRRTDRLSSFVFRPKLESRSERLLRSSAGPPRRPLSPTTAPMRSRDCRTSSSAYVGLVPKTRASGRCGTSCSLLGPAR